MEKPSVTLLHPRMRLRSSSEEVRSPGRPKSAPVVSQAILDAGFRMRNCVLHGQVLTRSSPSILKMWSTLYPDPENRPSSNVRLCDYHREDGTPLRISPYGPQKQFKL